MNGRQFSQEMNDLLWKILSVRDAALSRLSESADRADMTLLLRGALRTELEASEIAARWVPSTIDLEAKIAFAQQSGDEARHYQMIARRLEQLGDGLEDFDPISSGYGKLFDYMDGLTTTVERIAAAQFTREAIGYKSNELFMELCETTGDVQTAELYRNFIQPDEMRHHEWGKELLARLAESEPEQELAKQAVLKTLELAEDLRSLAAGKLLVETLPGC
jgi:1,2-phenylacetyl-CoA epoxidase catalytic subunit